MYDYILSYKIFMFSKKFLSIALLIIATTQLQETASYASEKLNANVDTEILLRQNIRKLEHERTLKALEEKPEKLDQDIVKPEKEGQEELKGFSFLLKNVEIEKSKIISEIEINNIIKKYINKEIKVEKLYSIIDEINKIYEEKGYLVCRAILPEQVIENGTIKILLIEGTTGKIDIKGNFSTREKYIRNRLPLKEGQISNFQKLNEDLLRFNTVNDIHLKINMLAGEIPRTTNYEIQVYEPKKHQFNIFADNIGEKSSGRYRAGLSYVNNSLFGNRDQLSIAGLKSEGTSTIFSMYSFPILNKGTKVYLRQSYGTIEHIKGELKKAKIKGKTYNYGIGLIHPIFVSEKGKVDLFIDWVNQRNITKISRLNWVDNDIYKVNTGFAVTYYKNNSVFYLKNILSRGKIIPISKKDKKDFSKYELFLLYQKEIFDKNKLSFQANGQYAFNNYLPSAEQFYIGGLYSVRGYSENIMGSDRGFSFSTEWARKITTDSELFAFLDGGMLRGKNARKKNKLLGTGFGYKVLVKEHTDIMLAIGFPLIKDLGSNKVDKNKIYITINHKF